MKKNLSLRIICIGLLILIVAGLFLPFVNYGYSSTSLFDMSESLFYVPYIIIGLVVLSILVLLVNKKLELCLLFVGFILAFVYLYTMTYKDFFDFLSYGYYLFSIGSLVSFIVLIVLVMKNGASTSLTVVQEVAKVENVQEKQEEVINSEPNQLAQSLMDKPVMNNLENNTNIMNDINNVNYVGQSNENSVLSNDLNQIQNTEDIALSPNNPLSSFLPSDFDPNKVVQNQLNQENVQTEEKVESNNEEEKKVEEGQSILSVMSQPMVSGNLVNNVSSFVQQPEVQQPEVQQPVVPEVQQPVVPEVQQPVVPEVQQPVVPEVQQPVVPEVQQPVVPEVQQPVVPEVQQPVVPEVQQPVVPEVQQPVVPEVQQPVVPEVQQPVVPGLNNVNSLQQGIPEVLNSTMSARVPTTSSNNDDVKF